MRACEPTGVRDPGAAGRRVAALVVCTLLVGACSSGGSSKSAGTVDPGTAVSLAGIHLIKHVVVIMQENRSFDDYFGTFPGADGIPMKNGKPTVCVPDPATNTCVAPFVDHNDANGGGPHSAKAADADIDGGKMDGFIDEERAAQTRACTPSTRTACSTPRRDGDRRDGVPHRERHPELLDVRAQLRAPGPHVRAERVVEPARAPVPGLGLVGALHPAQRPAVCHNTLQAPRGAQRQPAEAGQDRCADLRVDRPHLPAAQEPRVVGLLRRRRAPNPTARTTTSLRCASR